MVLHSSDCFVQPLFKLKKQQMPYKVFYFGPHAVSTFDLSHIAATHLQELKLHYLHTTRITTSQHMTQQEESQTAVSPEAVSLS